MEETGVELIGVPFDGWGRAGNQSLASRALRRAGIGDAFSGREVVDTGDLTLPAARMERAEGSGLVNEAALLAMTDQLADRVRGARTAGRFPVVFGADCSVLLGICGGLAQLTPQPGVLMLDGHQDSTPLDASRDGEAANMEVGLLLGLTGQTAPDRVAARAQSRLAR